MHETVQWVRMFGIFVGRNDRPTGMCWLLPLFFQHSQLAAAEMEADIPTGNLRTLGMRTQLPILGYRDKL